jgi:regulator of sigma E protease
MSSLLIAFGLSDLWWWISVILKVAIGLGAVIFVHELGHFLVAKLCGVKVEKFMVGFDIGGYRLARRWGETLYGIGILPWGGYVKMLGQDDDPAHIAEQMQKSQIDANSPNAAPVKGPDGETYYVDRRSYIAKSVPQRMAIISAGVVMNIIFAFIFGAIAYGMGVPYLPAVVSDVVPGSPAFQEDVETGDEIIRIGNRVQPSFGQLRGGVLLGDLEHGIDCEVRRARDGKIVTLTLKPQKTAGKLATVGIGGPVSLTVFDTIDDSPAAKAKLNKLAATDIPEKERKLMDGDEIIRANDAPIKDYREFSALLARQPEKPLQITVRRKRTKGSDGDHANTDHDKPLAPQELTFEVPEQPLHRFNFSMKMGPIASVRKNSPAAAAGLKDGDFIERVDGKRLGEGSSALEKWDAETLPDYLRRAASAGREVEFIIQRPKENAPAEQLTIHVKPQPASTMNMTSGRIKKEVLAGSPLSGPIAAYEIGVAYRIENEIAAVSPDTPASVAKIAAGDKIVRAKILFPEGDQMPKPTTIKLDSDDPDWRRVMDAIQFVPDGTKVELTIEHEKDEPRTVNLAPVAAEGAFVVARGFRFTPVERIRKAETFAEQLRYGWNETKDSLLMVFSVLRKLGGQVPVTSLSGPVDIVKQAGMSAAEGISSLLIFLTVFSANLAVLNFLPIPILDGGHMVFLAYEGIRGRPASEKFVVTLHAAGFIFIVGLMLYVLALDLHIIPRNL